MNACFTPASVGAVIRSQHVALSCETSSGAEISPALMIAMARSRRCAASALRRIGRRPSGTSSIPRGIAAARSRGLVQMCDRGIPDRCASTPFSDVTCAPTITAPCERSFSRSWRAESRDTGESASVSTRSASHMARSTSSSVALSASRTRKCTPSLLHASNPGSTATPAARAAAANFEEYSQRKWSVTAMSATSDDTSALTSASL